MADIIIAALIGGYCIYLIRRAYKNSKQGKPPGCAGCSGNCSKCFRNE